MSAFDKTHETQQGTHIFCYVLLSIVISLNIVKRQFLCGHNGPISVTTERAATDDYERSRSTYPTDSEEHG